MFSIQHILQFSFVTAYISAVVFEDCGSAYELTTVNIEGCQLGLPCFVTLGESVPVSVKFIADFACNPLDQDVVININFINLRPKVTPERCESLMCPVVANAVSTFTSVMSVQRSMAVNQRGHLRWRVIDRCGRQVLCFSVMVQTQNSLQKYLRENYLHALLSDTNNMTQSSFN